MQLNGTGVVDAQKVKDVLEELKEMSERLNKEQEDAKVRTPEFLESLSKAGEEVLKKHELPEIFLAESKAFDGPEDSILLVGLSMGVLVPDRTDMTLLVFGKDVQELPNGALSMETGWQIFSTTEEYSLPKGSEVLGGKIALRVSLPEEVKEFERSMMSLTVKPL